MLLAVDVHYGSHRTTAAAVAFGSWDSDTALDCAVVSSTDPPAPYRPGHFYERELPYLRMVVGEIALRVQVTAIIVDGHTWLSHGRPGLGAHLYDARERNVPVIGIAKSPFRGGDAVPVLRGRSSRPLYVSAIGMDLDAAVSNVARMYGSGRVPMLLRAVDRLARGEERPDG